MKYGLALVSACALALTAAAADAAKTTVTVPDVGTFQYFGAGNASVTYDGVTFSQSASLSNGNFYNVSQGFSGNPAVLSSQQQTTGAPNILVTLPGFASSAQFVFSTGSGSDVTFTFSNGISKSVSTTATAFSYTTPDSFDSGALAKFDTIQLVAGAGDLALNLRSITYDTVSSAVPETATWAMMIVGLGFVGGAMRMSRRSDERFTRRLRARA